MPHLPHMSSVGFKIFHYATTDYPRQLHLLTLKNFISYTPYCVAVSFGSYPTINRREKNLFTYVTNLQPKGDINDK
jgi:hypothetical protein